MSERRQTTIKGKSYIITFLYWILGGCFALVLILNLYIYFMKVKNENERIERILRLEQALMNNTLSEEVSEQIRKNSVLSKEGDSYYKSLGSSKELNELNRLLSSDVKNLDRILGEEYEKDIDLKDDYENMSLRIESIGVFSPITDTNGLSDEDYYKTIRTNTALKGSFPRMNGITHISAHSSVPIYNKFGIQDIFKNLKNVKVGDRVEIFTKKYKYVYEVKEVFKKGFDNLGDVFNQTIRNKLVLMTCPDFGDKDFHTSREFVVGFLKDIQTHDGKSVFGFSEKTDNKKEED